MKEMCRTLGTIVLVLGIIGSIALAWNNGVTVTYNSYLGRTLEDRNLLLTIVWFVGGIITTGISATILHALGEILEVQESIAWKVSSMENKVSSVNRKDRETDEITYKGSWKCSKCGRVNAKYTGTCACGQDKE